MTSRSYDPGVARVQLPLSASAPDLLANLQDLDEGDGVHERAYRDANDGKTRQAKDFRAQPGGLVTPERTPSPDLRGVKAADAKVEEDEALHGSFTLAQQSDEEAEYAAAYDAATAVESIDGVPELADVRYLRRHASQSYKPSTPSARPEQLSDDEVSARIKRGASIGLSDFASQRSSQHRPLNPLPFSLWDYLLQEAFACEEDAASGDADSRAERISNFLNVPVAIERMVAFGWVICFDAFLHTFTILPLRIAVALVLFFKTSWNAIWRRLIDKKGQQTPSRWLPVSHKVDLLKGALLICSCLVLHRLTDASQMYHSVRGQETIKLYVIFNVLEIADRLCCSFGQDVLDSLFSPATLARRSDGTRPHLRPLALFALAWVFIVAHTMVLFYQLVALNVAINSYDNALLTLLLSNQFVEIKGAVFKKFEKENLFQMSCADIVERFQLSFMLLIIAFRNLIELSGSRFTQLPKSFALFPSLSLLQTILTPAATVLCSEMIVDWLKHAFITKFNHIRPAVYGRFIDIFCRDLVSDVARGRDARHLPFVDQSPTVSRRLGFAVLPFGCLLVRVFTQMLDMLSDISHVDECTPPSGNFPVRRGGLANLFSKDNLVGIAIKWSVAVFAGFSVWACAVGLKLLIGINLRAYAAIRYASHRTRAIEDRLNDPDRPPIGYGKAEMADLDKVRGFINLDEFDADTKPRAGAKIPLEKLGRFDMVRSRIM